MLNSICITVDIDPDGLSGKSINRNTLSFDAFHKIKDTFTDKIRDKTKTDIRATWFVRIDEQIRINKESRLYLIESNFPFWEKTMQQNHEIAWHPHLYKIINNIAVDILTNDIEIEETIGNLWQTIQENKLDIKTFRNGEGWMTTALFNLIEKLNIHTDSTAISGKEVKEQDSKNWINAPNHHYYPDLLNCKEQGAKRNTIELPMNSWQFKASYDAVAKLRYINPAVHTHYFKNGLQYINQHWEIYKNTSTWVFISHPDEIAKANKKDLLYANNIDVYSDNILLFQQFLQDKNISVTYDTIHEASRKYK